MPRLPADLTRSRGTLAQEAVSGAFEKAIMRERAAQLKLDLANMRAAQARHRGALPPMPAAQKRSRGRGR